LTLNTAQPTPAPTGTGTTSSRPAFAALGLSRPVVAQLARGGITEPFPIQQLTIPDVLAGRDLCGKARTGSGKTLAFGLPMVERAEKSDRRAPRALVLVPTRELAAQVVAAIEPFAAIRGLKILAVYGGVSLQRQAQALNRGIDIVVATPGRLNDLLERRDMTVADVNMVVLDEADQMADMGFMPQVERILQQVEREHQTLLFSATLDGDVDKLVKRYQHDPVFYEVDADDQDPIEMHHRFIGVNEEDRIGVAADIAAGPGRTLFFVRTQRGADRLAKKLSQEGVPAGMLHGRMSQPQRERALQAFTRGTVRVLVATNIAARGIHVDGVDIVVHHDLPEDAKTYVHRSGRTARAGASGIVVTMVGWDERRDAEILRRQAGIRESIEPMKPGDPRLADLAAWTPELSEPVRERGEQMSQSQQGRPQRSLGRGQRSQAPENGRSRRFARKPGDEQPSSDHGHRPSGQDRFRGPRRQANRS
jgi:superfamily II DNA/RNA helicase